MPKVLPEYLELRRQQILDAAAACFSRRGFHQSTMQDICDEAGLSPGAVYRYFHSKEELIEGICAYRQQGNASAIEAAIATGTTLEALDELLRSFFLRVDAEGMQASCALFLEVITEAPRNERIRATLQGNGAEVRARLEELIRQSQAKAEFNPSLDPESIARVMVALYHGFLTQKLVDPDFDVPDYTRTVQALFNGDFWVGERPTLPADAAAAALRH